MKDVMPGVQSKDDRKPYTFVKVRFLVLISPGR